MKKGFIDCGLYPLRMELVNMFPKVVIGAIVSTNDGFKDHVTPRALETEEIPDVVAQFEDGAKRALEAGGSVQELS